MFFDEHGDLAKEATGALVSLSGVQNPPDLVDQDIRSAVLACVTSLRPADASSAVAGAFYAGC